MVVQSHFRRRQIAWSPRNRDLQANGMDRQPIERTNKKTTTNYTRSKNTRTHLLISMVSDRFVHLPLFH